MIDPAFSLPLCPVFMCSSFIGAVICQIGILNGKTEQIQQVFLSGYDDRRDGRSGVRVGLAWHARSRLFQRARPLLAR